MTCRACNGKTFARKKHPRERDGLCASCFYEATLSDEARKRRALKALSPDERRKRESALRRARKSENPERMAILRRRERESNREKVRARERNHKNRRRESLYRTCSAGVRPAEWREICRVFERNGETMCAYCRISPAKTCDHVVPLCRGGRHDVDNVLPACKRCNSSKGAKLIGEWHRSSMLEPVLLRLLLDHTASYAALPPVKREQRQAPSCSCGKPRKRRKAGGFNKYCSRECACQAVSAGMEGNTRAARKRGNGTPGLTA
jgi:5-methylcytosine-specific restriction endonuclease McrA